MDKLEAKDIDENYCQSFLIISIFLYAELS